MSTEYFHEYEKVISYIKEKFFNGELVVGSKLPTEREIAEILHVSRNSAREALSILSGMGIIERRQGSGSYVSVSAMDSVKRLISMTLALGRITFDSLLEFGKMMDATVCSTVIAKGIDDDSSRALAAIIEKMRGQNGVDELLRLDKEFHDLLIASVNNPIFTTLTGAISSAFADKMREFLEKADECVRSELWKIHNDIYESIQEKDLERARQSIDIHFDIVSKMIRG